jgi:hypothetical protein
MVALGEPGSPVMCCAIVGAAPSRALATVIQNTIIVVIVFMRLLLLWPVYSRRRGVRDLVTHRVCDGLTPRVLVGVRGPESMALAQVAPFTCPACCKERHASQNAAGEREQLFQRVKVRHLPGDHMLDTPVPGERGPCWPGSQLRHKRPIGQQWQ